LSFDDDNGGDGYSHQIENTHPLFLHSLLLFFVTLRDLRALYVYVSAKAGNNPGAPGGEAANWFVPESFRVCPEDQAASLFLFRHKSDGIEGGILKDAQLVCVRLVEQVPGLHCHSLTGSS
jgi:hypothetical protein